MALALVLTAAPSVLACCNIRHRACCRRGRGLAVRRFRSCRICRRCCCCIHGGCGGGGGRGGGGGGRGPACGRGVTPCARGKQGGTNGRGPVQSWDNGKEVSECRRDKRGEVGTYCAPYTNEGSLHVLLTRPVHESCL